MKKIMAAMMALTFAAAGMTAYAEAVPGHDTSYAEEQPVMTPADPGEPYEPVSFPGERGSGDQSNLRYYWREGMPDYISFLYEGGKVADDSGKTKTYWYQIGVVGLSDELKREILSIASPECVIEFFDCAYSLSEREGIAEALSAEEGVIRALAIYNSEGVLAVTENGRADELREVLTEKYGGIVIVTDEDAVPTRLDDVCAEGVLGTGADAGLLPPSPAPDPMPGMPQSGGIFGAPLFRAAAAAILAGVVMFVVVRLRARQRVRVTADGRTIGGYSSKQTEELIRSSAETPPDEVLDRILEKIGK